MLGRAKNPVHVQVDLHLDRRRFIRLVIAVRHPESGLHRLGRLPRGIFRQARQIQMHLLQQGVHVFPLQQTHRPFSERRHQIAAQLRREIDQPPVHAQILKRPDGQEYLRFTRRRALPPLAHKCRQVGGQPGRAGVRHQYARLAENAGARVHQAHHKDIGFVEARLGAQQEPIRLQQLPHAHGISGADQAAESQPHLAQCLAQGRSFDQGQPRLTAQSRQHEIAKLAVLRFIGESQAADGQPQLTREIHEHRRARGRLPPDSPSLGGGGKVFLGNGGIDDACIALPDEIV